jgi:hypothetical protein
MDRTQLSRIADGLMIAVAVSLPWSTSATGILVALWLLALIPTLDWPSVRRELMTPAGGLPVLLVLFGIAGMAWADVSFVERWKGLDGFLKLLVFPLLMTHARRREIGMRVFLGFLAACIALLIASWALTIWPHLPRGSFTPGVAVKSDIAQGVEFTLCAAGLVYAAFQNGRFNLITRLVLLALSCAFIADIVFIATSRTALVVIPILILVFVARQSGAKGFAVAVVALLLVAASLWLISDNVRWRVGEIFTAIEQHKSSPKITPSGERLVFWTKSIGFVENARWFGHGTGSIAEMFRRSVAGQSGVAAEVSTNPHNQSFAVAIQLGLGGTIVLWAMWGSHLLLFRGKGFEVWAGLAVVLQNVVGSLFNSFLFDFTEGWIYVIGAGVAAGMVRRLHDGVAPKP